MDEDEIEDGLDDYEAQRAANIAKNQALLRELQLSAASAGLAIGKSKKGATTTTTTTRATSSSERSRKRKKSETTIAITRSDGRPARRQKQPIENGPRRTSSRLAGLQADSEVAKRKAEEEYTAIQEAARLKRQRVGDDLLLSDVVVTAGKKWDRTGNFLVDVVNGGGGGARGLRAQTATAAKYERTFTEADINQTGGDKALKGLRQRMSALRLYERFEPNRIKITPERIYSLAFHPTPDKPLVFAGDKMGNLGIFDPSQPTQAVDKREIGAKHEEEEEEGDDDDDEEDVEPAITTFKLHTRTISSFLFPGSASDKVYTASFDSSIRSLDLVASKSIELYSGPPSSAEDDDPISTIDVPHDSPTVVYFSTLSGLFGRHDIRASSASNRGATEIYRLSEKKIGGFSLHPRAPHLLATASLDRTLKIWDLRKISGRHEWRLPTLLGEHESRLSVSHAAWNEVGQVATASYDDTIKIYDFLDAITWSVGRDLVEDDMRPSTIIKHNNQTGRWVTILKAQWQANPEDGIQKLCIGNMNRFVDVYTASGQQIAQLDGGNDVDGRARITTVPAVAQFHPRRHWLAAGTASGKLCLWT